MSPATASPKAILVMPLKKRPSDKVPSRACGIPNKEAIFASSFVSSKSASSYSFNAWDEPTTYSWPNAPTPIPTLVAVVLL